MMGYGIWSLFNWRLLWKFCFGVFGGLFCCIVWLFCWVFICFVILVCVVFDFEMRFVLRNWKKKSWRKFISLSCSFLLMFFMNFGFFLCLLLIFWSRCWNNIRLKIGWGDNYILCILMFVVCFCWLIRCWILMFWRLVK